MGPREGRELRNRMNAALSKARELRDRTNADSRGSAAARLHECGVPLQSARSHAMGVNVAVITESQGPVGGSICIAMSRTQPDCQRPRTPELGWPPRQPAFDQAAA